MTEQHLIIGCVLLWILNVIAFGALFVQERQIRRLEKRGRTNGTDKGQEPAGNDN
jgi:hypothetical protein